MTKEHASTLLLCVCWASDSESIAIYWVQTCCFGTHQIVQIPLLWTLSSLDSIQFKSFIDTQKKSLQTHESWQHKAGWDMQKRHKENKDLTMPWVATGPIDISGPIQRISSIKPEGTQHGLGLYRLSSVELSISGTAFGSAILFSCGERLLLTYSSAYLPVIWEDGDMNHAKVHDDVIKWKHFPRYWPFVQEIHRSRWIPRTKASDAELWCFLLSAPE